MKRKIHLALALLLATFACEGFSQGLPDAARLDAERERIELERRQLFDAGNPATQAGKGPLPRAADIERERQRVEQERKALFDADNPATRNAVNAFPKVPTPDRSGIDIEALARQYEQKSEARRTDELMVFASFTMPAASLKRLVSQARQVGAAVVLRGFRNNSLKETAQAIEALGEPGGNVLVNPNAFTKYQVKAVPTLVLASAATVDQVDAQGCALPDHYVAVSGDVTLDYALDEIARRAPEFAPVATRYLRQIRGQ
jgi:conjugal transfer pilus assembly protein TrbC